MAVSFKAPEYTANSDALGSRRKLGFFRPVRALRHGAGDSTEGKKARPITTEVPMEWQSFVRTRLLLTTATAMACMPATECCLITKVRGVEKRL